MRLHLGACMVALAAAQIVAPRMVEAQAAPDACVVPLTGNLYRVGVPNTPGNCRAGHTGMNFGITLPFAHTLESTAAMINLVNSGTGPAGRFVNSGGGSGVFALNNSTGPATIHAQNFGNAATGYFASVGGGAALMGIADTGGGSALFARAHRESAPAAHIQNTGTGAAAFFTSGSIHSAVHIQNTADGAMSTALSLHSTGGGTTLNVHSAATGGAIYANSSNPNPTANLHNQGTGSALWASSAGSNPTVGISNDGGGPAFSANSSAEGATGWFGSANAGNGNALFAQSIGNYTTAHFRNQGSTGGALYVESAGSHPTLGVRNDGTGPALSVNQTGANTALHITTPGGAGQAITTFGNVNVNGQLHINGGYSATGTKNAAVPTSSGTRLMYSEEATEVWFTDYGFGRLNDGEVFIAFDPIYAETANLNEAYHVFLQAYGAAEMYVTERSAAGFRVRLANGDAGTEFSYRIVAKRVNYEHERLEPAPSSAVSGGR